MKQATKKITPPTEEVILENETSKEIVAQKQEVVKSEADIDAFLKKRKEFINKVSVVCVEGKDYHVIQGKKSLAKGGAEKIASIFNWKANFHQDKETMEMLGDVKGTLVYVCTLFKMSQSWNEDRDNVGEGRGAATLQKNGGDVNKTIKMAQKSAFIDAVLRSSGLSDFFTQDLENMSAEEISTPISQNNASSDNLKPTEKQLKFIQDLAYKKGYTMIDLAEMQTKVKRTPSQMIDYLKGCPPKIKEELPVIQQEEITQEEKDLIESVPF